MSDASTARDQYEQYRFCYDNGHQQWIERAARSFAFWNGDQWDAYTRAKLMREGRPALTFNIIESLTRSIGADVPLLGQIPLDVRLREGADTGTPVVLSDPTSPAAVALRGVAKGLSTRARGLAGRSLGLTPAGR